MLHPNLDKEALLWNESGAFVFGVDEAGRGCLAGPVCASVVCWAPHSFFSGPVVDVRDSKKMTAKQREAAFEPVRSLSLVHGIGLASAAEIDTWNILRATHLAVGRALEQALSQLQARGLWRDDSTFVFLADGNRPLAGNAEFFSRQDSFALPLTQKVLAKKPQEICVVQGDSSVFSIASASVLAKVNRDHLMKDLANAHPGYDFALHKGYGTALHREKLMELGPCSEHRRSFAPVVDALALRS